MRTALFIFLFVGSCIANDCNSQQYNIRTFSFPQGLLTYNIKKTLQDKYGFIWIATQDGLYRFDGKSFEIFKKNPSDINSLQENFIYDIAFGEDEDLYISAFNGGIDVINIRTLEVTHLLSQAEEKEDGLPNLWITKIYFDQHKQLWMGGEDFLLVYNTITKKIRRFQATGNIEADINVSFIQRTPDSMIVVGAENNGILVFDPLKFRLVGHITGLDNGAGNRKITASNMVVGDNICFVSSGSSVYQGKVMNGKWQFQKIYSPEILKENLISSLQLYNDKQLWIGTSMGTGYINLSSGDFSFLNDKRSISGEYLIYDLFIDKTDNLWISSNNNLQLVNLNPSPFRAYTEDPNTKVRMNHLYSMVPKNNDEIYACGTDGLYLCNTVNGNIRKIKGTGSLGIIHYLYQTKDDLWVVSTDLGMYAYVPSREIISRELLLRTYPEWSASVNQIFNNSVTIGKKTYWAGEGLEGFLIWDRENSSIRKYEAGTSNSKGIPENHLHNLKMDREGLMWMLFDNNVATYDPVKDTVTKVLPYKLQGNTFNAGIFFDMYDDGETLWFGTYGGGINGYNEKTKKWTYITELDGLCNNAVYSILPENDSIFWVSTNNGLSRVNHKTLKCINYFQENGLQDNSFDETGYLKWNGKLFFSGVNGFTGVDASQYRNTISPFPVYIKRIEYINRNKKTILNNLSWDPLELPAGTTTATIWLSALSFSGNRPSFSYKIRGFQDEFLPVDKDNKIELNALTKGNYDVDIRYINEKGDFVDGLLGVKLEVLPFWYQTWWFRLFVAALMVSITIFILRLLYISRLRRQRAQLEKQLAVQLERQRISSEMHDDIGAGLSGIKLLAEMTRGKVKDTAASGEVEKIYESVGDISAKMKEVIWSLNAENDRLSSLISYIQRQARQWLENYPCQLTVNVPEKIPDMEIDGESRRNIFLTVKEAVHNIIKHSGADRVTINITSDDQLMISVSDNGKGMHMNENINMGNGLKNMKHRIHQLNGKIFMQNNEGFTLTFEIPYKSVL
ncbi:MAG TPA: ATP-binding protein [Chitinophagaceae bacterium]